MSESLKKILLSVAIAAFTAAATKGIEELSKVNLDDLFGKKTNEISE
jgi:hypothetical protein